MKKFVAFVMVLSLGMFCAVGCAKQPPKKVEPAKTTETTNTGEKPAPDKAVPAAEKPADTAAPAEKPAEKPK